MVSVAPPKQGSEAPEGIPFADGGLLFKQWFASFFD